MNITHDGRVIVRFTKSFDIYSAGIRASFPRDRAIALVKDGVAEHTHRPGSAAPALKIEPDVAADVIDDEPVEPSPLDDLPTDWKIMNGNTLRTIAKKVSDSPVTSKEDAIAAIELALEERAGR